MSQWLNISLRFWQTLGLDFRLWESFFDVETKVSKSAVTRKEDFFFSNRRATRDPIAPQPTMARRLCVRVRLTSSAPPPASHPRPEGLSSGWTQGFQSGV